MYVSYRQNFFLTLAPGTNLPVESAQMAKTWSDVLLLGWHWQERVKNEHESPDLWAQVAAASAPMRIAAADADNSPFTAQEQRQIAAGLKELRAIIQQTEQLSAPQLTLLDRSLGYLKDAAGRLGRLDWSNLLFSQIIKFGLERLVKQENLHVVAQRGSALFQWIWTTGQNLLGQ